MCVLRQVVEPRTHGRDPILRLLLRALPLGLVVLDDRIQGPVEGALVEEQARLELPQHLQLLPVLLDLVVVNTIDCGSGRAIWTLRLLAVGGDRRLAPGGDYPRCSI